MSWKDTKVGKNWQGGNYHQSNIESEPGRDGMRNPKYIYDEMRAACNAVLHRHGIRREHTCIYTLVSFVQIWSASIRQDYEEMSPEYGEKEAARVEIARRYGLSERDIANILYGYHDSI